MHTAHTLLCTSVIQLWSHVHRKEFHAEVDTDNLTESFNHALRSRYLHLQQDKTVSAFVKVLVDIVFTEQEREYVVATTQQTTCYRLPRYSLPEYLQNRPRQVQAACLLNMERANEMSKNDITEVEEGTYNVKGPGSKEYTVSVSNGHCSCYEFVTKQYPCKHMFAVFAHTQWSWSSLPHSLTESEYMTLDTSAVYTSTIDARSTPDASEVDISSG